MRRRKTKWNKARERVTHMLDRGRLKGCDDRRPRHGTGYRGRLAQLLRELRVLPAPMWLRCSWLPAGSECQDSQGATRRDETHAR